MAEIYDDSNKNMRDDMNRGADPEALVDMGYEVPEHMLPGEEEALTIPETQEQAEENKSPEKQKVESVAKKTGSIVCADCMQVVPCAHVGVRPDGSRYTKGY